MADGAGGAEARASEKKKGAKGPDPLIGRVINDRFKVTALIARGGMGKVYRAEQAPLGREIALKVLTPNYSGDSEPEFHKRFFLEASTCSKLTHPNTVTIFDYGRTDDDIYYIAMELLEGRTLHRRLRKDGPVPASKAMHIARQVCRSLREAHSLGVIHRDLKPANIFLMRHGDEKDYVKVLDFGLVKDLEGSGEDLTQTGLFMGSPKYMAPEQIKGERIDARADIYALGVIMYEMLTGKVPFDRPNSVNILMAHVHDAPPPLLETNPDIEVSVGLNDVVMKALAKVPDERFESMDAMLVALKMVAASSGGPVSRSVEMRLSGEFGLMGTTGQYAPLGSGVTGDYPTLTSGETRALGGGPGSSEALVTGSQPSISMRRRKNRTPLIVALVGGMALIGAVVAAVVFGGHSAQPAQATPAPTPAPTPPARPTSERDPPRDPPDPTPAEPALLTTMVHFRSDPEGAMVQVEGGDEYGPTPTDVEWAGEDAERGRRVTFVFSMVGYQDYQITRVVTGNQLNVSAELEPIRGAPRRRGRGTTTGAGRRPTKGYKQDPY